MTQPLVLSVFWTFDLGGAQTRFAVLANRFGHRLRHVIVSMDGRYGAAAAFEPGLLVERHDVAFAKGQTLANRARFRRYLRELNPDLLITHNWGTMEWAMANWPRLVRHVHIEDGFGPDEAGGQIPRRVLTRRLLLRQTAVVVPSMVLRRIALETWRLPAKTVHYIPNGIDCARFASPPDPELVRRWAGDGPLIGTVAALRPEKNIGRLIRAFALAATEQPCRLAIAGDGAERASLEALAQSLGVRSRVTFLGNISGTERVYGGFDIFALTSDTEQMPYSVLEAMAASRPLAATDVGDIRHMVAPENHPFIVAKDEHVLASALRQLISDERRRKQIGEANRARAFAEYDQSKMLAAFERIFGLAA